MTTLLPSTAFLEECAFIIARYTNIYSVQFTPVHVKKFHLGSPENPELHQDYSRLHKQNTISYQKCL